MESWQKMQRQKQTRMEIGMFEFAMDESVVPSVVAMRSEKLGFASYWLPEHPIIPFQTSKPYPNTEDDRIPQDAAVDHATMWVRDCGNVESSVLGELDALTKEVPG